MATSQSPRSRQRSASTIPPISRSTSPTGREAHRPRSGAGPGEAIRCPYLTAQTGPSPPVVDDVDRGAGSADALGRTRESAGSTERRIGHVGLECRCSRVCPAEHRETSPRRCACADWADYRAAHLRRPRRGRSGGSAHLRARAHGEGQQREVLIHRRLPRSPCPGLQLKENICDGAPDRIRTCDLRLRRPTLYPLSYRREAAIIPARDPVNASAPFDAVWVGRRTPASAACSPAASAA